MSWTFKFFHTKISKSHEKSHEKSFKWLRRYNAAFKIRKKFRLWSCIPLRGVLHWGVLVEYYMIPFRDKTHKWLNWRSTNMIWNKTCLEIPFIAHKQSLAGSQWWVRPIIILVSKTRPRLIFWVSWDWDRDRHFDFGSRKIETETETLLWSLTRPRLLGQRAF